MSLGLKKSKSEKTRFMTNRKPKLKLPNPWNRPIKLHRSI